MQNGVHRSTSVNKPRENRTSPRDFTSKDPSPTDTKIKDPQKTTIKQTKQTYPRRGKDTQLRPSFLLLSCAWIL